VIQIRTVSRERTYQRFLVGFTSAKLAHVEELLKFLLAWIGALRNAVETFRHALFCIAALAVPGA